MTANRRTTGALHAGETAAVEATVREAGQPVTSGHVWFFIGDRPQGAANIDSQGIARGTAGELRAGDGALVAVYQALDGTFIHSAPAPFFVHPATPAIQVVAYPANAAPGALTYATVRVPSPSGGAPVPQGDIEIRLDGRLLGKVSIVSGGYHRSSNLTISGIASGHHQITATYLGDMSNFTEANFTAASSTTTVTRDLPTATQRYVNRLYESLLGRIADASGLQHWSAKLGAGTTREQVARALTNSAAFRRPVITNQFVRFLDRPPTAAEMARYLDAMNHGLTFIGLSVDLVNTHLFYAHKTNDRFWLYTVYSEFHGGRNMTTAENQAYLALIRAGVTKRAIATSLATTTEDVTRTVASYYAKLLGRPTRIGDPTYVALLQRGGRDENVIAGIVASDEFYRAASTAPVPSSRTNVALAPGPEARLTGR